MRMKLYEVKIERADGAVSGHIVAPTEKQAAVMLIDHDLARGKQHLGFTLERVDNNLPSDRQYGLEHVLAGPAGFARYCEPTTGWIVDHVLALALSFFKFFTPEGEETYVVASEEDEAMAIYATSYTLADGEHRLFRFVNGLIDLPAAQCAALHSILEFGPRGVAVWDDKRGWSVRPSA